MTTEVPREPTLFAVPFMQVLTAVVLFVALLNARRDLTLLCLAILGLMALARAWSRATAGGLRLASSVDRSRVFPGERLRFRVVAENTRRLPAWLQVTWAPTEGLRGFGPAADALRQTALRGRQRVSFQWEATALARGVHPLGALRVEVADPLGFFPRSRRAPGEQEVVVYPRRVPLRPLSVPARDFFGHPGRQGPVQDPIYLLGTRDYQHTQPSRHIHWNASARHARLQEKIFEPSQHRQVLLLLDVEPFAAAEAAEAFERTLEVVGSLALELDRDGCAVGFAANGATRGGAAPVLPPGRSLRQLPALLELLARLEPRPREALLPALRRGLSRPSRTGCVCFTHRPDALAPDARGYLHRHRVPLVHVVSDDQFVGDRPGERARGRVYRLADLAAGGEAER